MITPDLGPVAAALAALVSLALALLDRAALATAELVSAVSTAVGL